MGLWDGLPISSNPWFGPDREVAAAVRESIIAPMRLPDGPPLWPAELRSWRIRAADDVAITYVAFYADNERRPINVYAVEFRDLAPLSAHQPVARGELWRRVAGQRVVVVSGSGFCADPVLEHVATVVDR